MLCVLCFRIYPFSLTTKKLFFSVVTLEINGKKKKKKFMLLDLPSQDCTMLLVAFNI